nr:MAG TPA: hypothetical protein [Herelleviridae sp.]
MSLDYFENAVEAGLVQDPNDLYRDLNQAFIDEQWENTSARYTIFQQDLDENGNFVKNGFSEIEVWLNYVVGQGTSMRNGHDFVQISFRDINQFTIRGRYYKFENNYWLTTFDDEHDSLAKSIVARRCNNVLRIVDPLTGAVFSAPCAVDYDMSSPSSQVSRYIITPNNHAVVIVQGNEDTRRLFKINTRYILGGRPFKLYAYQNAIYDSATAQDSTLLYLDLYLDEIHDKDDLVNGIADNGTYDYEVKINSIDMTLSSESTGVLTADVMLNGEEVDRTIVWSTSNSDVVTIGQNGGYNVIGEVGQNADIIATLDGNSDVNDVITITIGKQIVEPRIYLNPAFDTIREYQTIEFDVGVSIGGNEIKPETIMVGLDTQTKNYLAVKQTASGWALTCNKRSPVPLAMTVTVVDKTYMIKKTQEFEIKAVSMMG